MVILQIKQKSFLLAVFFLTFSYTKIYTQNLQLPLGSRSEMIIERWTIQGYNNTTHPPIKPYQRQDLADFVQLLDSISFLKYDKADIEYAALETQDFSKDSASVAKLNNPKPLLKYLYKTPSDFFSLKSENFYLKLNPVLGVSLGRENNNANNIFENHRGIEIRGGIDNKVYFYSRVLESQVSYVGYLTDRIYRFQAIPGNGFYKNYNSKIFNVTDGFDYNNANAYIGFNISKHIGAQFGYGSNFIGNGIRSLFLSDYANNYLYLKLNTRIGRFHYQNIFGELQAAGARDDVGDELIPKKYFAAHYLSYAINNNWHVGFFETVVFSRKDRFEFQYLNPVILYRTVEGA